jgi:hypothetical protein
LSRSLAGALCVLAGLAPILAALDIAPFGRHQMRAPAWVVLLTGGLFVLAGVVVWTQGTVAGLAVARAAGLVMAAGLASVAGWVAFGPGPRSCGGSISLPLVTAWRAVPDLECRVVFGLATVMGAGMVALILAGLLRQALGAARWIRALESAGTGVLTAALAPLLLIMVVLSLIRAGVKTAWDRLGV